jgi:hypothetical protein
MAMKTKMELKDVFNGLSSLFYSSEVYDFDGADGKGVTTLAINWEYELPVTVDTLQITQDDPTINHYKVIGIQGDWTSSAEAGDFSFQFTVPTKAEDVIKLAFGADGAKSMAGVKMADLGEDTWAGTAVKVDMTKVTGTIGLLDETKSNMMLITDVALYAKPLYENPSTEPFAIQFSGSIETSGNANFAFLKKA